MIGYFPISQIATGGKLDIQVDGSHDALHLKRLLKNIGLNPIKTKQIPGTCNWIVEVQPTRKTSDFQLRRILGRVQSARIV